MHKYDELLKKMKISNYKLKLILNKPDYVEELDEVEFDTTFSKSKYDLIVCFTFSIEELEAVLADFAKRDVLNQNGYIYFIYPKKNNPKNLGFIHRDSLLMLCSDDEGYFLDSDLRFCRMMSFNQTFTICGLKNEPKSDKKKVVQVKSNDYIQFIPEIKDILKENLDNLNFYNSLSNGYQKDWARYIYSAKTEDTRQKRIKDMKNIISKGYKSKDLYRISRKNKK